MRRTDQPMASMRWWMCSRSGCAICRSVERIDRPVAGRARTRRISASALSAIGSAKIRSGTPAASAVAPFCQPVMAVAASRNPTSRLPLSPRKIDAGSKLKNRNPIEAPTKAASSIASGA